MSNEAVVTGPTGDVVVGYDGSGNAADGRTEGWFRKFGAPSAPSGVHVRSPLHRSRVNR